MSYYFISIGGTGAKVMEALTLKTNGCTLRQLIPMSATATLSAHRPR